MRQILKITNIPDANKWLDREYRHGLGSGICLISIVTSSRFQIMKKINRREFIRYSTGGLGTAFALAQIPLPLFLKSVPEFNNRPVGFQTFPIRDMVARDFTGTLKMMAGQGYQLVEMCSPQGYAAIGFGPLVKIKPSDMRKMITRCRT